MDESKCSDSILVNSSYKRMIDKTCENVFVMPVKKTKHEENKLYADNDKIENIFEVETIDVEYDKNLGKGIQNEDSTTPILPDIHVINDQVEKEMIPETEVNTMREIHTVDEMPKDTEELLVIPEQITEEITQEIEAFPIIEQKKNSTSQILTSAETIEQINTIDTVTESAEELENSKLILLERIKKKLKEPKFQKDLDELIPEDYVHIQEKIKLDIKFDASLEANYCFKPEEFFLRFSQHYSPLDTMAKQLVFRFISVTCSQISNLLFENVEGWHIYSENTIESLVKCFTNIIYDLTDDYLVPIFESKISKKLRILHSLNHVLLAISCVINDRKKSRIVS